MEQSERLEFMTKYNPKTFLGNIVRKLLVVMVLTGVKEDLENQDISQACKTLLRSIEKKEIPVFAAEAEIIMELYKEIADNGISIGS